MYHRVLALGNNCYVLPSFGTWEQVLCTTLFWHLGASAMYYPVLALEDMREKYELRTTIF